MIALIPVFPAAVRAEHSAPVLTELCDIGERPADFDGKFVQVRARIIVDFEISVIEFPSCKARVIDGIWFEYGRGPSQATLWCCGDLRFRGDVHVRLDDNFARFDRYVKARRNKKPLYAVTATMVGRLDAVPTETCRDGKHICPKGGGFGHFGMFSARLVLQSVSDVRAEQITVP